MKWLKRAGWVLCVAVCCEAGLWLALVIREGQLVTPRQVVERFLKLSYAGNEGCSFLGLLHHHPYLGYTYRSAPVSRCNYVTNSMMLSGPEHPIKPAADTFYVFVTGGSVAEHLLNDTHSDGTHYLSAEFNRVFQVPSPYKKFAVIGAAVGDWRMPQQLIALNLFHQSINAVIDLSGFNELYSYMSANFPYDYSPTISQLVLNGGVVDEARGVGENLQFVRRWPALKYTAITAWWLKWRVGRVVVSHHQDHLRFSKQWGFRSEADPLLAEKLQEKINYHRGLFKNIAGLCQVRNWLCASFIQPMPLVGKPLSKEEQDFQDGFYHIAGQRENFQRVYELVLEKLTREPVAKNLYIGDLSRVFASHPESIYSDQIHYIKSSSGPSKGNQLLVKEMFSQLEKRWKLKRR